jgi:alginate O-acetyltransferase complex protein AlgI
MLLVASYVFYCAWDWRFASLLVFSTLLDFTLGKLIYGSESLKKKRFYLLLSLVGNLGILGFFKYYNFFLDSLNEMLAVLGLGPIEGYIAIILPLGISFYTFQTLSYTLDVYRGRLKPTSNLVHFALFVAFFPQLIAGPIVRARQFLPQLRRDRTFDEERMRSGLYRILKGLIKKIVIADALGRLLVDPVFSSTKPVGGEEALLAMIGFHLQIGFDFSAYADIAIGSARLLGFELPENFRAALRAVNLEDFWRRWHITLTTWLRDYVYIPLTVGKSSKGNRIRPYLSLILTMGLVGLWHGANWTFVLFGLYHGIGLALTRFYRRNISNRTSREQVAKASIHATQWAKRISTQLVVALSVVLFRSADLQQAKKIYLALLSPSNWGFSIDIGMAKGGLILVLAIALHLTPLSFREECEGFYLSLPASVQALIIVIALTLVQMFLRATEPYVYFQF